MGRIQAYSVGNPTALGLWRASIVSYCCRKRALELKAFGVGAKRAHMSRARS